MFNKNDKKPSVKKSFNDLKKIIQDNKLNKFKERSRNASKRYYDKNRLSILEKKKLKRELKKSTLLISDI